MVELAPAGEGDDGAGLHKSRSCIGIRNHRRRQVGLDHLGVGHFLLGFGGNGHGGSLLTGKLYNPATKLHAHILNNPASKLHTIWSCPANAIPLVWAP
jgi:hypothetical protein